MKMSDFTYNLPEEKIAKFPPKRRGTTKLLVVDRKNGEMIDQKYSDIPKYVQKGDIVVLNETKVEKRRTFFKTDSGRRVEILFLNKIENGGWYCLVGGGKHIAEGDILTSCEDENICLKVGKKDKEGFVMYTMNQNAEEIFTKVGHTPIPPYMKRNDTKEDYIRYNTVFARIGDSVAAPTASLNLTKEILERIKKKGCEETFVELQVGWGTFAPVREENIEEHKLHTEEISVSKETADRINNVRKNGGKIWAFGTTVARTLESVSDKEGFVSAYTGSTGLYIYPGYKWKCVDHLITNFHMPDSSLILLVSSFAGRDLIQKAYSHALSRDYKFLSYGDSMLIL